MKRLGPRAHLRLGGQLDHRLPEVQLGVCGPHVDRARSGPTPGSDSVTDSGSSSSSSSAAPAALGGAELRTPPAAGVGPAPCSAALMSAPTRPRPRTCRFYLQRNPEFSVEPKSWSFGPSFYNPVLSPILALPSVNQSRRPKSSLHLIFDSSFPLCPGAVSPPAIST